MSIGCPLDAFNYTPVFMGLQYIFWDFIRFGMLHNLMIQFLCNFTNREIRSENNRQCVEKWTDIYFLYSNELGM